MRTPRTLLGITLALMMLALPATAHTDTELTEWLDSWAMGTNYGSMGLALEDMKARHPCRRILDTWVEDCEPVSPPAQSAPSSSSAPAPSADRGMGSDVEQWRGLVSEFAWDVEIALCLMGHESGGNPNAYNPSGASGLMQVLASWADNFGVTPADLFDPRVNLTIAAALYADGGWGHWSPWNRGECH